MKDDEGTAESAADRARRLWDGDASSTARKLLEELIAEEAVVGILLPWVSDRVRATVRSDIREAEEAAWTSPAGKRDRKATSVRTQTGALPALDNLEYLLSLPVLVPVAGHGTQAVPWRDMTVADHEARIGLLRKPLPSIQAAVGRHEWSIREIQKYRVRCLGDIDISVLESDMKSGAITAGASAASDPDPVAANPVLFRAAQ
jgi:hypothetical protein